MIDLSKINCPKCNNFFKIYETNEYTHFFCKNCNDIVQHILIKNSKIVYYKLLAVIRYTCPEEVLEIYIESDTQFNYTGIYARLFNFEIHYTDIVSTKIKEFISFPISKLNNIPGFMKRIVKLYSFM